VGIEYRRAYCNAARIDDPAGSVFRWFPSIAVNAAEQVLIGYTTSSATTRVSAAYSYKKCAYNCEYNRRPNSFIKPV